ncbi:hypothetical protein Tco_0531270 [Tanacetum coccineum]
MDTLEDLYSKYSSYIGLNKLSKSSLDGVLMDSADESSLMNHCEIGRPSSKSCLVRSFMVPKFRCESLRCHNHDSVEVALEGRQTGEEAAISEMEILYKLDSQAPVSKSSPSRFRT